MKSVNSIMQSLSLMTMFVLFTACGADGQTETAPKAEQPAEAAEADATADAADLVRQLNQSLELHGRGTVPARSFSTVTAPQAWLQR
jgi:hypothetical protein